MSPRITRQWVRKFSEPARSICDEHGRATPGLRAAFKLLEKKHRDDFTAGANQAFHSLAGKMGATLDNGSLGLPESKLPFWLMEPSPLDDFQSADELPTEADVVVIGAGLTGASAAYHLAEAARQGLKVVVLEANRKPGAEASGRNGGNLELMPENGVGSYAGLVRQRQGFIQRNQPCIPSKDLRERARREAETVMLFCQQNCAHFAAIVAREGIDCDFSSAGWLRIAESKDEETGFAHDVQLGKELGIPYQLWTPQQVEAHIGLKTPFSARFAPKSGNYHPFKFVIGILGCALTRGVELYTQTPVRELETTATGETLVQTARGTIRAKKVILATNAFTGSLAPELKDITCYESMVMNLEHVANPLGGMTVTEHDGELYYNFPRSTQYVDSQGVPRGMAHMGGGLDRPAKDPRTVRRSPKAFRALKKQSEERFPETLGQPATRAWTGPMAFTPDGLPVLGFLPSPGQPPGSRIVGAGYNGYGGSYALYAGEKLAELALSGETPLEPWARLFSPERLIHEKF